MLQMKSYFLVCAYSVGVDCGREGTGGGPIWSFELICTKTINGKQKQSRHCLHVSRTVRFPSAAARFARSLCIHCLQFQCRLSARGQHTASWISRQNSSAQNSKSLIKIYLQHKGKHFSSMIDASCAWRTCQVDAFQ